MAIEILFDQPVGPATTLTAMKAIVAKFVEFYERNETKVDLGFFVGGFLFDIVTLSDIDDPLAILQQVVYLTLIFSILINSSFLLVFF